MTTVQRGASGRVGRGVDYLAGAGRPMHLSDDEFVALQKWLVTEGLENWATRISEANEALARVLPFHPALADFMPYSPGAKNREAADRLIAAPLLARGDDSPRRRSRHPQLRSSESQLSGLSDNSLRVNRVDEGETS